MKPYLIAILIKNLVMYSYLNKQLLFVGYAYLINAKTMGSGGCYEIALRVHASTYNSIHIAAYIIIIIIMHTVRMFIAKSIIY